MRPFTFTPELTQIFASLFRGNESSYNRIKSVTAQSKKAPVINAPLTLDVYRGHLSSESYDGPGGLGIFPAFAQGKELVTKFLTFDFDNHKLEDIAPVIETFWSNDLFIYLTRGTTGRGVHAYIFLTIPLVLFEAVTLARTLAGIFEDHLGSSPEVFPSNSASRGQAIFLPYRGAARNGFGFNPLLDPSKDYEPLRLDVLC